MTQAIENADHPWGIAGLWMAVGDVDYDNVIISGS